MVKYGLSPTSLSKMFYLTKNSTHGAGISLFASYPLKDEKSYQPCPCVNNLNSKHRISLQKDCECRFTDSQRRKGQLFSCPVNGRWQRLTASP